MSNVTLSNSQETFDDVMKDVEKFAKAEGVGSNSMSNFLMRCVRGGAKGALSSAKSTNKDAPDDAKRLLMHYAKCRAQNDASKSNGEGELKASTVTSKSSNFRTAIDFGIIMGEDAVKVINRAWALVGQTPAAERVQPFECLNRVIVSAREQRRVLNDDEILELFTPDESKKKEKTAADYLREARKRTEQAYKLDASQGVANAMQAIDMALSYIVQDEKVAAALATLRTAGVLAEAAE